MTLLFSLQVVQLFQRHLPLVIVSAVAWCTASLLFAANVQAKIVGERVETHPIVVMNTVHVVNQLETGERSVQEFRHYPAMLENVTCAATQRIEHRQVFIGDCILSEGDIASLEFASPYRISATSEAAIPRGSDPTFTATAGEVGMKNLLPQRARSYIPFLQALGAGDANTRPSMPTVCQINHIAGIHRRMFSWQTQVSWAGH